jgi:hypothetical protein
MSNQLLATVIDVMQIQWWQRCGGMEAGPQPDPIPRPGVKRRQDHRRGHAPRSETNQVLGMRLDSTTDPDREAKIRNLFRGPNTGPIRDLSKAKGGQ